MSDERDIVESLRAECDDVYDHSTRIVLRAAADEIERLRADVARLKSELAIWEMTAEAQRLNLP